MMAGISDWSCDLVVVLTVDNVDVILDLSLSQILFVNIFFLLRASTLKHTESENQSPGPEGTTIRALFIVRRLTDPLSNWIT